MKRKIVYLPVMSMLFFQFVNAQNKLSVSFTTQQNQPLENITVALLRSADSGIAKISVTNRSGMAEFEDIKAGNYLVKGYSVNHKTAYSSPFSLSGQQNLTLPAVVMELNEANALQNVTVVAKKPFIQRLNDRIVVNVENSIVNAGSTAMDVLERSPGITVNSSDMISLKGKSGVIVMIDGKPTPMSGEELSTYLRSIPSTLIQQIDIITNPSAKYDAAGNAGIIDIKLKKDQRLGTNGTINAGYGQGIYSRGNAGLTFNNRGKKINLYGSAGFNKINWMNNMVLRRDFYESGVYKGSYDQDNFVRRQFNLPTARVGMDYYINKRAVLGVILNTNLNNTHRSTDNRSLVLDQNGSLSSSFNTLAGGKENYRNYVTNINFKYSIDTTGQEISIDADYAKFIQDWAAEYTSNYFNKFGVISQPAYILSNDQDGDLQIRSAKIDYVKPLAGNAKLEAGLKTSFVSADNSVLFFDKSSAPARLDSSKSNHFLYDENINAGYLNYKMNFTKVEVQLGIRAEATRLKTQQLFSNEKYDTSYLQFFPSAFVSYKISDDKTIGISVSHRIDRPTYGQLNPFKLFVDQSFYVAGNPNLLPQTTWAYALSYNVKQWNAELSYSHTKNILTAVLMPTANRVTLQTTVNFASEDYFGLSLSAPVKITKWWNAVNNLNVFYNKVKGFVAETVVDANYLNAIFSMNNSLSFKKNWSGEFSLNFNSGGKNGVMEDRATYGIGAGIQKTILQNRATVRLNITDILWKTYPRFKSYYTTYRETLSAFRDTRIVNLTFTYRFGNSKVQAARRRTTASEEERRRAGGN